MCSTCASGCDWVLRVVDLMVSFSSPLDDPQTASEGTSFMQTQEGAARIMQTCDELLSVLTEKANHTCEILEAVDMVILQFPPTAGNERPDHRSWLSYAQLIGTKSAT